MARWIGLYRNPDGIIEAANNWKVNCLINDGSVLFDKSLWSEPLLAELETKIAQHPLEESGPTFLEKLLLHNKTLTTNARLLLAEVMWLLYLFPSKNLIRADTKSSQIRKILSMYSASISVSRTMLEDFFGDGIGNPGQGFNQFKWRELNWAIRLCLEFKRRKKEIPIDDVWLFTEWVDSLQGSERSQFRHMLLYLLYPDFFERVTVTKDKISILENAIKWGVSGVKYNKKCSLIDIDRQLFELGKIIRSKVKAGRFDYYAPLERAKWKIQTVSQRKYSVNFPDELRRNSAYPEGASLSVIVNKYERDPKARKACLDHYGARCIVCEFDFGVTYGQRGSDYIHVHHRTPLSKLGKNYLTNPVIDLVPVCPNCHAMIHKNPEISPEELRDSLLERTKA